MERAEVLERLAPLRRLRPIEVATGAAGVEATEEGLVMRPSGRARPLTITAEATAAPLQDIPGFMGGKTGYTDLAGGNLAAVFDLTIGRPVVAVVLHSTEAGRFADIRTLLAAARAALAP